MKLKPLEDINLETSTIKEEDHKGLKRRRVNENYEKEEEEEEMINEKKWIEKKKKEEMWVFLIFWIIMLKLESD